MTSIKNLLKLEVQEQYTKEYNLIISSSRIFTTAKVERMIPKYLTLGDKKFKNNFPKEVDEIMRIVKSIEELNKRYTNVPVKKPITTATPIESKIVEVESSKSFSKLRDPNHIEAIKLRLESKKQNRKIDTNPEVVPAINKITVTSPTNKIFNLVMPIQEVLYINTSAPGGVPLEHITRAEGEPEDKIDLVSSILRKAFPDNGKNTFDSQKYQKYYQILKGEQELDNDTILEIKDRKELTDIGIKMGPAMAIMKAINYYRSGKK